MACIRIVGGCPITVRELNSIMAPHSKGIIPGPEWTHEPTGTVWPAVTEDDIVAPEGSGFFCGENIKGGETCRCNHLADLLCDWPIGDGKTCDLPLCRCCAKEIGADLHVCAIHWPMWLKQAGVERVNSWPPKRRAKP